MHIVNYFKKGSLNFEMETNRSSDIPVSWTIKNTVELLVSKGNNEVNLKFKLVNTSISDLSFVPSVTTPAHSAC